LIIMIITISINMPELIKAKSILSNLRGGPDPYFGLTYSMNLYRGCQHGCIYCDTRSTCYGVGDISKIRIKENAIELLRKELSTKRKKGTIGTGSMNDPYMPIEKKTEHVRHALEAISEFNWPMHSMTKSSLITRDVDLLKKINETYCAASFSITAYSDDLARKLEPGASSTSDRFKAMAKLASNGIYTGVILTPVLPFITDTAANLELIIRKAKDSGADYIISWMGMTNRDGQREYFYRELDKHFPGVREKYEKEFGMDYSCSSPDAEKLYEVYHEACAKYSIPTRMKFYSTKQSEQLSLL
jgi:DNA repair photolyase